MHSFPEEVPRKRKGIILPGFVAGFSALLAVVIVVGMAQELFSCMNTDHVANALIGQRTGRNGFFGCLHELLQMAFFAALLCVVVYIFGKDVVKEMRMRRERG
jgi:hypothetical protein